MADKYDLIVVGAGPGGYVAAIRASQLGLKVACIERERPGGICLNWGCIPTKALLKSAEMMRAAQHAGDHGVVIPGPITFDWKKVIARSRGVADKMASGIEHLFRKYKVTSIPGTASFKGRGKLEIKSSSGTSSIEGARVILATGARAKFLPGIEADGDRIITYREAMILPEVPKSVVVIGAGAIGIEFADFWNAFGVEITVIEFMPRILPIEDEDVSATLARLLKKKGMTIHTGSKTTGVKVSGKTVTTSFTTADGQEKQVTSERVLMAVGVRANVEGFGFEGMGIALDRGFIQVDDQYRTTSPGIWAIGDCAGAPLLAHVAMAEGVRCVESMVGKHVEPINYDAIPGCTYCDPEVASIGKTEAQAREAGLDIAVGRFPFSASGKALAAGHPDGFIKVITNNARGEVVGVHCIGHGVTDLIAEISLGMSSEATAHDILAAVHPHPTLSEVMLEATAAALGEAVHI
ncbi:MAG TPA: dihydrolipoyl dehydrogenase [Polyangia bacterium]|jgi:dihydrolipoamide dehydrogenase|nr:dihydrolipoyl dehydrogenase [Polyangia bacterium]